MSLQSPHPLNPSRGCQTQEKVVAACAKTFAVIADYRWADGRNGVAGCSWSSSPMQQAVSLPWGEGMERVVRTSCIQKAVVFKHIAPESITCCMESCVSCHLTVLLSGKGGFQLRYCHLRTSQWSLSWLQWGAQLTYAWQNKRRYVYVLCEVNEAYWGML